MPRGGSSRFRASFMQDSRRNVFYFPHYYFIFAPSIEKASTNDLHSEAIIHLEKYPHHSLFQNTLSITCVNDDSMALPLGDP